MAATDLREASMQAQVDLQREQAHNMELRAHGVTLQDHCSSLQSRCAGGALVDLINNWHSS